MHTSLPHKYSRSILPESGSVSLLLHGSVMYVAPGLLRAVETRSVCRGAAVLATVVSTRLSAAIVTTLPPPSPRHPREARTRIGGKEGLTGDSGRERVGGRN